VSGQLVGEVIDAAEAGQFHGLSQGDLLALVAIAEKCGTETRQGSVRIVRIQATMGQSKRTAVRALQRLKDQGHIRVVKRGFKSHGVAKAPIYELAAFAPPKMAQTTEDVCAILGGVNGNVLAPKQPCACAKSECACAIDPPVTCGDATLDGSIDGPNDGGRARQRERALTPLRCSRHKNDDNPSACWECKRIREAGEAEQHAAADAQKQARADARARCTLCDDAGWLRGPDGAPGEPAVKCAHQGAA
jgi:hypothetical protein